MGYDMGEDDRILIAKLEERVENWMSSTNEYRLSLCHKIDKIMDKLAELPCKERSEIYKGIALREKLIWAAIGVTFTIMTIHLGWR